MEKFVRPTKIIRTGLVCAAFMLLPCSVFGQSAPAPTPSPAASTPRGQSADPREEEQPREGPTQAGRGTSQTNDQHFIKEAADGGMAEVELGQLAADKASNAEVKEFAQRMVKDHSQANDQLKQIASQKGLPLPSSLSPKDQATKNKPSKLSGDAFDQAYMSDMLKDHKTDIAAFQKETTSGKDPDLKQFASQTLPTLKEHLKQAKSVSPKLTSSTTG